MAVIMGLDFETRSGADIRRGLDIYFNDPDYALLLGSVKEWHSHTAFDPAPARFDFVMTDDRKPVTYQLLRLLRRADVIVAHNASFERMVLRKLIGTNEFDQYIVDSAVIARVLGAGSKLEAAGPQLLGRDKMESGIDGIKMFSVPREDGTFLVDEWKSWDAKTLAAWDEFGDYCDIDAEISCMIYADWSGWVPDFEWKWELLTQRQNDRGWYVDLDLVEAMRKQRDANLIEVESVFRAIHDPNGELNFRSTPQMKKWTKERGVNCTSFDEQHVERYIARLEKLIPKLPVNTAKQIAKHDGAQAVLAMLKTKQELGGSSLSKLETILDMVGPDGRLRGQYLHCGAGQTWRTSGRGVQMQNLKRLGDEPDDVDELFGDDDSSWDNAKLARNVRQVFEAEHPDGELIVGDFSSVESRGLAYLADEEWKLDAYRANKDMYKVLASKMLGVEYDSVDKKQRQTGKVGELSCGYGAGPGAVARFAQKMHVDINDVEASQIVRDWRDTNPGVVDLWARLDAALRDVVERGQDRALFLADGSLVLTLRNSGKTPASIIEQVPAARNVTMTLETRSGELVMHRVFAGVHKRGNDICYLKPSELKSGKLWYEMWHKNGESGFYKLYGGKLTGILVQSFCRQLFFRRMAVLEGELRGVPGIQLIGQFHDELVVEWNPVLCQFGLERALKIVEDCMTGDLMFPGFPLVADVKHGHRYIK